MTFICVIIKNDYHPLSWVEGGFNKTSFENHKKPHMVEPTYMTVDPISMTNNHSLDYPLPELVFNLCKDVQVQ